MENLIPPSELVQQWADEFYGGPGFSKVSSDDLYLATRAAQWGADQELEACCNYFTRDLRESLAADLRAARRPKAPSLKEQALEMLENAWEGGHINNNAAQTIRRALEQLDDNV